jgi:hypothetical protein
VQVPVVGADEGDGVGGFDVGHGGSRIANPDILPAAILPGTRRPGVRTIRFLKELKIRKDVKL